MSALLTGSNVSDQSETHVQKDLYIQISTGSAFDPIAAAVGLVSPSQAAHRVAQNTVEAAKVLRDVFGLNNVSASVLSGRATGIQNLLDFLQQYNIPIGSLDVPGENTLIDLLSGLPKSRSVRNFANRFGWYQLCVDSQNDVFNQITSVASLEQRPNPTIIRTDAGHFIDSTLGDSIIAYIKAHNNKNPSNKLALSVEIDWQKQDPAEYADFVLKIREAHPDIEIYISYDYAHVEQAIFSRNWDGNALSYFAKIMGNPKLAEIVCAVELHTWQEGSQDTHGSFLANIAFQSLLGMYGTAYRNGRLSNATPPTVVIEPDYRGLKEVTKPGARAELEKLKREFDSGLTN